MGILLVTESQLTCWQLVYFRSKKIIISEVISSYLDVELPITTDNIYLLHSTVMQTIHGHKELDSHTPWLVQAVDMNDNGHLDKSYPSDLHSESCESLELNHIYLRTRRNKQSQSKHQKPIIQETNCMWELHS